MSHPPVVTITIHDRKEWIRLAKDAEADGLRPVAVAYLKASQVESKTMLPSTFDRIQGGYRRWLIGGWNEFFGEWQS